MIELTRQVYERGNFGGKIELSSSIALLLVDFCNAFLESAMLGGGNIVEAAVRTEALLAEARRRGWPVAHSKIAYLPDGSDANLWFEKVPSLRQLVEGTDAVEFTRALRPVAHEYVVRKVVPSAFFKSELHAWLCERHITSLVIAGCTTSGCVRASAVDALSLGLRTVVVSDCVGDRALLAHEASLTDLAAKYVEVMDMQALFKHVQQLAS